MLAASVALSQLDPEIGLAWNEGGPGRRQAQKPVSGENLSV